MRNITIDNYFSAVKKLSLNTLPEKLQKGHAYIEKATSNGSTWQAYDQSDVIRKVIDLQIEHLNLHLAESKAQETTSSRSKPKPRASGNVRKPKTTSKPKHPEIKYNHQERIPEEVKLMRRFVNLNGKTVTSDQVLRIINAMQRAMVEKRIRKTSPFANQILLMQDKLISLYNSMDEAVEVKISDKVLNEFKALTVTEKVFPSVQYIKRFIGLHGKTRIREKAERLIKNLEWAKTKNILTTKDPFKEQVNFIYERLQKFVDNPAQERIKIESTELNGLHGVVQSCDCDSLSGFDFDEKSNDSEMGRPRIMNSLAFNELEFDTIGFKGKWLDLIGDPSAGFTAMVFGRPKMGKSYLCVEFAGYLARNHGRVLYVAREERLDATLQRKLKDKAVAHPNLDVADNLPNDLSGYEFVFLDSVNKLGLSPTELDMLKAENPNISFVYIFQTTKLGNFRGGNEFQHDVDVVIEVPEFGQAVQFGRFNQGGEMAIFEG